MCNSIAKFMQLNFIEIYTYICILWFRHFDTKDFSPVQTSKDTPIIGHCNIQMDKNNGSQERHWSANASKGCTTILCAMVKLNWINPVRGWFSKSGTWIPFV